MGYNGDSCFHRTHTLGMDSNSSTSLMHVRGDRVGGRGGFRQRAQNRQSLVMEGSVMCSGRPDGL